MIIYLPYVKKIFIMLLSEFIEILEKKRKEYGDAEIYQLGECADKYPVHEYTVEPVQESTVIWDKDKLDTEVRYHTKYFLIN